MSCAANAILTLHTTTPVLPQGQTALVDIDAGSSASGSLTLSIPRSNKAYFWETESQNVTISLSQGKASVELTSNYVEALNITISQSNVSIESNVLPFNHAFVSILFVRDSSPVLWLEGLGPSTDLWPKHMVLDSGRNVYMTASNILLQKRSATHAVIWSKNMSVAITGIALSPDDSAIYVIGNKIVSKLLTSNGTLVWNVTNGPESVSLSWEGGAGMPANGLTVTAQGQIVCVGQRFFNATRVLLWQLDPATGAVVAHFSQDSGNSVLYRVVSDPTSNSVWAYGKFDTTAPFGSHTLVYKFIISESFIVKFALEPNSNARNVGLSVAHLRHVPVQFGAISFASSAIEVDRFGDVIIALQGNMRPGYGYTRDVTYYICKYSRGAITWGYFFERPQSYSANNYVLADHISLVSDTVGNIYFACSPKLVDRLTFAVGSFILASNSFTYDKNAFLMTFARDGTLYFVKNFPSTKYSFISRLAMEKSTNFLLILGDVRGNMSTSEFAIDTSLDNVQFLAAVSPSIAEYPIVFPQRILTEEATPVLISLNGSYFQLPINDSIGFRGRVDILPTRGSLYLVAPNGSLGLPILVPRTLLPGTQFWYKPPPDSHSGLCRSGLCDNSTFAQIEVSLVAFGAVSLSTAAIDILVTAVPSPPIALPQVVEAIENVMLIISLTGYSTDGPPNGHEIPLNAQITRLVSPGEGNLYQFDLNSNQLANKILSNTLVSNAQNQVLFRSEDNRGNYTTSFEFILKDDLLQSVPVTITINVAPINQRPVGLPQNLQLDKVGNLLIFLSGTDVDNSELSYFVSPPNVGQLFQCDRVQGQCVKGALISASGTPVTDVLHALFYSPPPDLKVRLQANFLFFVSDGQLESVPTEIFIGDVGCAPGYFEFNRSLCMPCDRGYFSSAPGQTQCQPCKQGFYQLQIGQQECQKCPQNVDECAGAVVVVTENYWAVVADAATITPVECPRSLCLGGSCAENRIPWNENPLCGKCLDGYSQWGNKCIECFETSAGTVFFFLFLCFGVAVILRLAMLDTSRTADGVVTAYFLQTALLIVGSGSNQGLTTLASFDFNFGESMISTFGLSCPFFIGPIQKFGVDIIFLMLLLLDLALMMLVHFLCYFRKGKHFGHKQFDGYARAACFLFLLAFNRIIQTCVKFMSCIETGASRVVATSPDIDCSTSEYATSMGLFWFLLVAALLLVPGFILALLARKRTNSGYFSLVKATYDEIPSVEARMFESRWGVFFAAFEKKAFWYQLVILCRRTLLIVFDSVFVANPSLRALMLQLATIGFVIVHVQVKPFRPPPSTNGFVISSNAIETFSLSTHVFIAVLVGYQFPSPAGIVWFITLLVFVPFIFLVLYQSWRFFVRLKDKRLGTFTIRMTSVVDKPKTDGEEIAAEEVASGPDPTKS